MLKTFLYGVMSDITNYIIVVQTAIQRADLNRLEVLLFGVISILMIILLFGYTCVIIASTLVLVEGSILVKLLYIIRSICRCIVVVYIFLAIFRGTVLSM